MNRGGIESQIMNMYRKIDRNKFQFDFLVTRDEVGIFDEEIEKLGGKIYRIPSVRESGLILFIKNMNSFFKKHKEYKIVHSHMNTWSGLFLGIAKRNGVKVRIAQSHSAQQGHKQDSFKGKFENLFKQIMKKFIKYNATDFWAVGQAAGEWLYGKKIASTKMKIIHNAKDLELYKFDEKKRTEIRAELKISKESFVIGHVGSFTSVKNHIFLIDVFNELTKKGIDCHLCLVGDGLLRKKIEEHISKLKLNDRVSLLGIRTDVNKIISIFDVFMLPSLFEGMPNVLIEAQAGALKCLASDSITREIDMGMNLIKFISLNEPMEMWVNQIINVKNGNNNRNQSIRKIYEKGYDINLQQKWIEKFYADGYKREC